jgi:hypothetical protein
LALFVPKPELKVAIFEGTTDPLDWNISDLADGNAFLGAGYVYLESTVIKSPYEKLGLCILLRHALSEIESALTENGIPDRSIEFFGLAGSPEGKNLMQNTLGLHSIMFAHNRKDKMELFNGFKSTTDFTALKNKVKAITNCLILRKARFSV